jgi:hypothetical protein
VVKGDRPVPKIANRPIKLNVHIDASQNKTNSFVDFWLRDVYKRRTWDSSDVEALKVDLKQVYPSIEVESNFPSDSCKHLKDKRKKWA